ncbi:MAG: [protein-PII] uridylyltransferase [Betaproteobacteria bacterium RIFCSPLOWO2_02_FULL_62_17]|nr:MAG: [protein-PII] uridylyltransferase [Betaproteobacteria bacterium RIFCSPLOWO2_02_FULL_62_17]
MSSTRKTEIARLRGTLKADRAMLRARFEKGLGSTALLHAHRKLVDAVLTSAWKALGFPRELALLAVGGYGQGNLFPHSDVDMLVLMPADPDERLASRIEGFIGRLWDLGLEVGHSVRTVAQCLDEASRDVTVRTALLEARPLAGRRALIQELRQGTLRALDTRAFLKAKQLEQAQRHAKYLESPYSLEPNIKESPGGLRDLQVIRWIALGCGLGSTWSDLAKKGFITVAEARQAARHERFLQTLRIRLHYLAGRREDRLLFDYQDRLAREMGYATTVGKRASEQLMQRYYRGAKAITQLNVLLMQNLEAAAVPEVEDESTQINERFSRQRDLLDIKSEDLFAKEPRAILECFQLMQRHSELKGMTAKTLRALWRAREIIDTRFRNDPVNKANFLALLQQPRGIVHELRRMNQYGVLGAYLPAFRRITGQMQHDLFHVYTVDQHILTVVRNLRRFTMVEFAHEYPLCSRLIAGFDKHWLLYIAAIFHDIAKGRGGDHSLLGMADARRFCRAHGLALEDTELVVFLVEHHLTMSAVAQKQDLADPDVLRRFVDIVKSERRLIALYLITVADIRGTSPKVWNAWKGKLLEDLFHAADRLLRGENVTFDNDILHKQEEALRLLRLYGLSDDVQEELWKQLDVPYFLRHDAQEIAWQTRHLYRNCQTQKPVVKARLSPVGEGLQVMIYTLDQPQLFARICGYFGAIGFNIVDAKIHTTRNGYALDTFQVMGGKTSPGYREMITLIEHDLASVLLAQEALAAPLRGRISRQLRHFPIQAEVHIQPDDRGQFHLLSITAGDRPGLLYSMALVLARYGVNLHMAKVVTLGGRAEDVFVLSGAALQNPRAVLLLEQDLLETLTPEPMPRAANA